MSENGPYEREGETVDVIDDRVDSQPDDEETDGPRYRNEEWLRDQYWLLGKSAAEIADECGVSSPTVIYWMEKYGIERRSLSEAMRKEGPHTDEDWLREQYVEKEKSAFEIADGCGVAQTTIRDWMEKYGIEERSKSEAQLKHYEKSVVFREEIDADESSGDVVEIDRGNARYKGSPIGMDHVNQHIGERPVVEVVSPWRDETWLRDQYVGKGKLQREIAEESGVGEATIHRWMKRFEIERRSLSEIKSITAPHTDEDWLREQYVEKEKSQREIADECGVAQTTIYNWMKKFGIETRRTGQRTEE